MTQKEEKQLVKKVQSGDRAAFEKLVNEYQAKIYNLALRMTGSRDDAYDMTQDAFIKAYRSIGDFRSESSFYVWLYRLAVNVCLDFLRAEKKRAHVSLTELDETDNSELEIPDERFDPQTEAEKAELRQAVRRGLLKLPDEYRAILILREIDGLSYDEIGSVLSLEPGTVKSRIFRARKKLCAILLADRNFSAPAASKEQKEV